MATVTLGQYGCLNADLEIAQGQPVHIAVTHQDEAGNVIDYTGDSGRCRMQRGNCDDIILDGYVETGQHVYLNVPASETARMRAGVWRWDLFAGSTRIAYGKARVKDTCARDRHLVDYDSDNHADWEVADDDEVDAIFGGKGEDSSDDELDKLVDYPIATDSEVDALFGVDDSSGGGTSGRGADGESGDDIADDGDIDALFG